MRNFNMIYDEYENLDIICNAGYDSVIYDLPQASTGKRGRPTKRGNRLSLTEDFSLLAEKIGDYYVGVRKVLTNIFRDTSVQEFRLALSQQINQQVIFATFVKNVETAIKSNAFVKALKSVLLSFSCHG